jgi:hypothetical protein
MGKSTTLQESTFYLGREAFVFLASLPLDAWPKATPLLSVTALFSEERIFNNVYNETR